jgi:hypothetical protein
MKSYDTVTEAVSDLKARGFNIDFNFAFDEIICPTDNISLKPHEFEIVEVHRFEGDSNPSDEDVVYAVESKDGKLKGIITSAFGLYADAISNEMIQKLTMHRY